MRTVIIIFFTINCLSFSFSQQENFNLPPGVIVKQKTDTSIDYSYLLTDIQKVNNSAPLKAKFMRNFSQEDWDSMAENNPEEYSYYIEALNYYNQLSNKVKSRISTEQLWYIYVFDIDLKNELLHY